MPTYEYECSACGHRFEKFQSMTAPAVKKCPECGKNKVQKLISSGAGLIFKGSGFYITDYRDSGYTEKAKADSAAGSSNGGDNKSGGDSKPAETAKPAAETSSKPAESKPAAASSPKSSGGKSGKKGK
jgi:putative FmdB family regulatory protein